MPARLSKQILFGALYLVIFGLIAGGVYFAVREEPTCFDNRKNQGEEQADCGGPCKSCEIKKLQPIQVIRPQALLVAQNLVSLVAEVRNPNFTFGARQFAYRWEVYDTNGTLLREIKKTNFIYPGEAKYLIEPSLNLPFQSIGETRAVIEENPDWVPNAEFSLPNITLRYANTLSAGSSTMVASGEFVNNEAFQLSSVRVTGVLYDAQGQEVAVSQTEYRDALSFARRFFQVTFAIPPEVMASVDTTKTRVFIETVLPR